MAMKEVIFGEKTIKKITEGRKTCFRQLVEFLPESAIAVGDILRICTPYIWYARMQRGILIEEEDMEPLRERTNTWIKITNIRMEHLQDATIEDMHKEGLCSKDGRVDIAEYEWEAYWNYGIFFTDLDRYGYEANPLVWVIEFEQCEKPEGAEPW